MASRTLFFVGKPPPELSREFPRLRLLPYALVLREAQPRAKGCVLVLGDLGLGRVDPVLLRRVARDPYTRVILAPGPVTSAARLREWRRAGFGEIVAAGDLERAIMAAAGEPVVVRVPDSAWVSAVVGDGAVAADLLRAVPRLPRPKVAEWSERAGVDPRVLRTRCRATFGHPPGQLLWMRTDALIRQERLRRIPTHVLALVAGFPGRHAMYHAYSDRGLPFPPAGPGIASSAFEPKSPIQEIAEILPAESDSRPARASDGAISSIRPADEREKSTDEVGRPDAGPPASG